MKKILKKQYSVCVDGNILKINRNGEELLTVPASASLNGVFSNTVLTFASDERLEFLSEDEKIIFTLEDDCILADFSRKMSVDTPIFESKMFTDGKNAINIIGFDRAFCPQPRNNGGRNMDYYNHLPDISSNGYFSPAVLEFAVGSKNGWVSFGLLDLPDTKICKMDTDRSFLVESCGGNKVIKCGESYNLPQIVITFPKDEWDAISLFREKLIRYGRYTPKKPGFSELPSWWKNPFVCTYGDQMLEERVGQLIDTEWVNDIISKAEKDWGIEHFNLIIDDSWQLPHAFEPIYDEKRFPNFRGFIESVHERGHKVILWQTPLFDKITNGFKTRAQRLGVLSETELTGPYFKDFPGCYMIDYTSDNARQFIREIVEILFGDGEGQYNADGIKLDFLGLLRDPAIEHTYSHPEKGIGMKELLLFMEMFYEEAKRVKADVLIDSTTGDPRFEHVLDFNRLHDTHCGVIEKEMRARIVSLGCPDLPIDSDGALMFTSWLRKHYISAALYAVPSNYYTNDYHDSIESISDGIYDYYTQGYYKPTTDAEKKRLGVLFSMVKYRPDGYSYMESDGNWVLKDGGQVNAITQKGETVVYYPTEKCDTGYIFTFQDEVIIIPLYGRKFSELSPAPKKDQLLVDYARDVAIMRLTPGIIHTFKNSDSGDSADRVFSTLKTDNVETEMNYVN